MSGLELIAAVLGVIAVWLTVKQNAWCWPIGLIMVLIYAWLFYEVKLYSGMLLQVAYALLQVYGWWQWKRPERQDAARQVSSLRPGALLTHLCLGVLLSAALGAAMATWTDAALPWLDASLTGFSLVAQWWMAQKRLQCWPLWAVVDIIYVGQYLHQHLYFTAALFAVLTLIALRGWLEWYRDPALVKA
ncbi:UNVERIFIED_ORG: nicotinamide mononucleotide transporter [Pseudomonas parafulva]|jgi:nicotinamide mononucleotide transporter|uniref:Nicotinamide riboside transporter PnuC n=3 Tax=Pseudomonas TaxID=286 RepID=A0A2L1WD31_9PSED|nr:MULTISPECIES: nicotinamide riboside transporter PnuC [Pseudomonas]MCY4125645.1 nicotinamide riboside transporter PnuC [Pseudomonas sp.]MDP9558364.1 nicotinamide mononucleotide transporter [Pseudomonas parafulva]MDP9665340.1 nicotinamide mononucleotide transporter [Pseudomonas cremoricolorata]AVF55351.1 nicotinamide riboside transporter PnuC [Pseudomonas fulva]MBA1209013.1 nicotinamide mononucleotide transporter [Pseudomonas fulva]